MIDDTSPPPSYQRRIVSGIRPGGRLHLGNYFGSIHDCLQFQYEYVGGAFYFIADLHEMTSILPGSVLREKTIGSAMDYLALGLQPDMVSFYLQSDVPQVSELMWILSCITPSAWIVDTPSGVPASPMGRRAGNAGLLMYPVLMAADCLALRATDLPIGADQRANVYLVQEIARQWNDQYGSDLFPIPDAKLSRHSALPGINGARMSKSAGNSIPLFAEREELETRVDAIRSPADPDAATSAIVLELLEAVGGDGPAYQELADGGGDEASRQKQARRALVDAVWDRFADARQSRRDWIQRRGDIEDLLHEGGDRARMEATETLELVRDVVGIGFESIT